MISSGWVQKHFHFGQNGEQVNGKVSIIRLETEVVARWQKA